MRSALCARRQAGCSTRTRLEEGAAAAAGVAQLVIHKLDVQDAKAAAVDLGLRSFAQGSRRGVPQNWVQGNDQGAGLPPTSPVAAWHAQGRTNRVRAPRWPTRAPAASRTPPSSQRAAQPCATPVGSAPGQTRPRRLHPHNTRRRPACGRGATNRRSKGVQPRCGQRARVRLQRLDARLGGSRRQHVLPCSSPQHGTNPLKLPCSRRSSKRRRGRQPPPPPPSPPCRSARFCCRACSPCFAGAAWRGGCGAASTSGLQGAPGETGGGSAAVEKGLGSRVRASAKVAAAQRGLLRPAGACNSGRERLPWTGRAAGRCCPAAKRRAVTRESQASKQACCGGTSTGRRRRRRRSSGGQPWSWAPLRTCCPSHEEVAA